MAETSSEYKDAIGVLNYNQTTRNEHLKRNGGLYALYEDSSYASIGEYYEIYFKTEEVSKSILNGKSISGYTHDNETEYSKEITNQYFNGITNIESFNLEEVTADAYPRWNGKRPEYIVLDVADGQKRLVSTPGDGAKIYLNGFLDNPSEALQETAKSTYDAAATGTTYAKPYVGFTWSDSGVSLSNGVFDVIDGSGYDMPVFHNAMDTTTHSMYADPDVAGTSVVVSSSNNQNEFDSYQGIRYGSNNLLAKTAEMFKSHKIKTLIGRFHTSNDSGSGNYNNTYEPFDSAKLLGLGNPHGRGLVKKEVSNGDYTYSDKSEDLVNGYFNPYCRSWTYHHQYSRFKDAIRPLRGTITNKVDGERDIYDINMKYRARFPERLVTDTSYDHKSGELASVTETYTRRIDNGAKYLKKNTVLQSDTGLVRITPSKEDYEKHGFGADDNTGTIKDKNIKKYMFSIENLAWSDGTSLLMSSLSPEQLGPNNGRIMWFPPYNLNFSESVTVNWNKQDYIGRGEKVYTYTNTERKGNLTFTILIDHPAIANSFDKINAGGPRADEMDVLRFFAGCNLIDPDSDVTDDVTSYKKVGRDAYTKKQDTPKTEEQKKEEPVTETVYKDYKLFVFFPNDYSGTWCNKEGNITKIVGAPQKENYNFKNLGLEEDLTTKQGSIIFKEGTELMYNRYKDSAFVELNDTNPHDFNKSYKAVYSNIISYTQYIDYLSEKGAIDDDWFLYLLFGRTLDVPITDKNKVDIEKSLGYEMSKSSGVTDYSEILCDVKYDTGKKNKDGSIIYGVKKNVTIKYPNKEYDGQQWSTNKNNVDTITGINPKKTNPGGDPMQELFKFKPKVEGESDIFKTLGKCGYYGTRQSKWSLNKLYYRADFDLRQTRKTNLKWFDKDEKYVLYEGITANDETSKPLLWNNIDYTSSQLNLNIKNVKTLTEDFKKIDGISDEANATNTFAELIYALMKAGHEDNHPFKDRLEALSAFSLDEDEIYSGFTQLLDVNELAVFNEDVDNLVKLFTRLIDGDGPQNSAGEKTGPLIKISVTGSASKQDSENSPGLANRRKMCIVYTLRYVLAGYVAPVAKSTDESNDVSTQNDALKVYPVTINDDYTVVVPEETGKMNHNTELVKRAKHVKIVISYAINSTNKTEDNTGDKTELINTKTGEKIVTTEIADVKKDKEINYITSPNSIDFKIGEDDSYINIVSGDAYYSKYIEFLPGTEDKELPDSKAYNSTKYIVTDKLWFPYIKVQLYKYDDFNYALRLLDFGAKVTDSSQPNGYSTINYFEKLEQVYYWKKDVDLDDIKKFGHDISEKIEYKTDDDGNLKKSGKYSYDEFIELYKEYIEDYFTIYIDEAEKGNSHFKFEVEPSASDATSSSTSKPIIDFSSENNFKAKHVDVELELYCYRDTTQNSQTDILNSFHYAMHPVSDKTGYDYSTESQNGTLLCLTKDFNRGEDDLISVFEFCAYPVGTNKSVENSQVNPELIKDSNIYLLTYLKSDSEAISDAQNTMETIGTNTIKSLDTTSLKQYFSSDCQDIGDKIEYSFDGDNGNLLLKDSSNNETLIEGIETEFDKQTILNINGSVPEDGSTDNLTKLIQEYRTPYAIFYQMTWKSKVGDKEITIVETEPEVSARIEGWRNSLSSDKSLTVVQSASTLETLYQNIGIDDEKIDYIFQKMIEKPLLKNNVVISKINEKLTANTDYIKAMATYKDAISIAGGEYDTTVETINNDQTLSDKEKKKAIEEAETIKTQAENEAETVLTTKIFDDILPLILTNMYFPIINHIKIISVNNLVETLNYDITEKQGTNAVNSTTASHDGKFYGSKSLINSLDPATCIEKNSKQWYISGESYKKVLLYLNNGLISNDDWTVGTAIFDTKSSVTTTDMAKNLIYAITNGRRNFYHEIEGGEEREYPSGSITYTAEQQLFDKKISDFTILETKKCGDKFPDNSSIPTSSTVTDKYTFDESTGRLKILKETGKTDCVTVYSDPNTSAVEKNIKVRSIYLDYENYLLFKDNVWQSMNCSYSSKYTTPKPLTTYVMFTYSKNDLKKYNCYKINASGTWIATRENYDKMKAATGYDSEKTIPICSEDTQYVIFKGYNGIFHGKFDKEFYQFSLNIFDDDDNVKGFDDTTLGGASLSDDVSAAIVSKSHFEEKEDYYYETYTYDTVTGLTFNVYSDVKEETFYSVGDLYNPIFNEWVGDNGYTFTNKAGNVVTVEVPNEMVSNNKYKATSPGVYSATLDCLQQFFKDIEVDYTQVSLTKDYSSLNESGDISVLYEVPVGYVTQFKEWTNKDSALGYKYFYTIKKDVEHYYCPLDTYIKFCGDENISGSEPKLIYATYNAETVTDVDGITSTAETYTFVSNSKYVKNESEAEGGKTETETKYIKKILEDYPTVIDYDAVAMKFYNSVLKDKNDAEYYKGRLYLNSKGVGEYTDYINTLTLKERKQAQEEAKAKAEANILTYDNIAVRHIVNPLTNDMTDKVRIGNVSVEEQYTAYDKNGNPMRYDEEYRFFERLKEDSPLAYKNIVDKVKYFNPAYHSISPEGFNARLTFLQQCTRQGRSVIAGGGGTAGNLAFGKMPVCVLRIGDFINTKIVIESMSINYQNGDSIQWDLNPEGIGVQPMFATVTLGISLLGGQSLDGPISRLQNAVTFNYYANAPVYDNRADRIITNKNGEVTYEHMFIPGERYLNDRVEDTDINTSYIGGADTQQIPK